MDITYSPVRTLKPYEGSDDPDGLLKNPKVKWAAQPDCCDSCIYTVCDSADDFNIVADHVGAPPTNWCFIYRSRASVCCGGLSTMQQMAVDTKERYQVLHNLEPQKIPSWSLESPDITWRQIVRDHRLRVGGPMEPHETGIIMWR